VKSGASTVQSNNQALRLLSELDSLVAQLEQALSEQINKYIIPEKEAERRQRVTSDLKNSVLQLKAQLKSNPQGDMDNDYTRNALFGQAGRGAKPYQEDDRTALLDDRALMQEQEQVMTRQDEGLDLISRSAQRLKQIGNVMSDELDDQNEILGDLQQGMDHTEQRVKRETAHVVHVTEKAKAGGMFCCIVLLIIAIIVVAAVPKPH